MALRKSDTGASPPLARIWTIGHSNRSMEEFAAVLQSHKIEFVADVRLLPGSRRHPHFNRETLTVSLRDDGMGYEHFHELGGRRQARPDSRNKAWRNEAFRGYADHMETAEFGDALQRLTKAAAQRRVAIMCAEILWWQCHRGLIADSLKVRGTEVLHIIDAKPPAPHPFTAAARVEEGVVSYGGDAELL